LDAFLFTGVFQRKIEDKWQHGPRHEDPEHHACQAEALASF